MVKKIVDKYHVIEAFKIIHGRQFPDWIKYSIVSLYKRNKNLNKPWAKLKPYTANNNKNIAYYGQWVLKEKSDLDAWDTKVMDDDDFRKYYREVKEID